jgi:hypothetical protein
MVAAVVAVVAVVAAEEEEEATAAEALQNTPSTEQPVSCEWCGNGVKNESTPVLRLTPTCSRLNIQSCFYLGSAFEERLPNLAFRFPAAPVESSRASPPHRPRDDGLAHPADSSRSNLASTLGLLSRAAAFQTPSPFADVTQPQS